MFIIFDEQGNQIMITTFAPVMKDNWVLVYKQDANQRHIYSLNGEEVIDNGILDIQPPPLSDE